MLKRSSRCFGGRIGESNGWFLTSAAAPGHDGGMPRPHLRDRLVLIARLPEKILLERLAALPMAELRLFARLYGPKACRLTGRCRPRKRSVRGQLLWSQCVCAARRPCHLPPSAVALLARRLEPEEPARPLDPMVSLAQNTEAKSFDLANREEQGLRLWHHGDFLQRDTFDGCRELIHNTCRKRNGDRMRQGARVLGTVVTRRAA